MNICANCILPETFPGVRFDAEGICNHCRGYKQKKVRIEDEKKKYAKKFQDLLETLMKPDLRDNRSYDILMAYSGGKDSTYTMSLLKNKYALRILAVSFDNGFISETSTRNIKKVTDRLGIDHMFFKPAWNVLKQIFSTAAKEELYSPKTLERASTICTSCIGLVKSICLKTAIEKGIPMVGFGWSPGQAPVQSSIMKNNPSLNRMAQQAILKPLKEIAGDVITGYFLHERDYLVPERFPWNVHPMAWEYYNEDMILEEIQKLGWEVPKDTDTNSSNCLINAFANSVHLKKYGFHPYVWEIANMVREGIMSREEGYAKIYTEQPQDLVKIAEEKLDI